MIKTGAKLYAELVDGVLMALGAIAAHKLRSALTLLGIVIGVFSIILVMTALRGLQNNIETELSDLGAHTFQVRKWPALQFGGHSDREKYRRRKQIDFPLVVDLRRRASLAASVGLETRFMTGEAASDFERTNPDVQLIGASAETFPAKNWVMEEGRAILETDIDNAGKVAVLGNSVAKKLFPFGSAVGSSVKFDGVNYRVIGLLEAKGGMSGADQDLFIAIPVSTGMNRYGRDRSVSILVQARDARIFEDTMEQTRGILRTLRKVPPGEEDDFEIVSNDSLIEQFRNITLALRAGVTVISSIALLAAGVGIMNIMLVSVTERTREIGIRRAIGAKKRNIMAQFVLEAVILCEIGGVIGVILGLAAGNAAAFFLKMPPVLPLDWVVLGLVICSLVGIIFGTYPAYKAANLDPIDSLRYE